MAMFDLEMRVGERRVCVIENVENKRLVTHLFAKCDASFCGCVGAGGFRVVGPGFRVASSKSTCAMPRLEYMVCVNGRRGRGEVSD